VEELTEGVDAIEKVYRKNRKDPALRRSTMVGYVKLAKLLESRPDRGPTDEFYRKGQILAEEAVRTLPNNTDASRDLGVVYSWRSLFMASDGAIDSALSLHERGAKIAEELAAADPNDVLQQADLANGHFEVGTILMRGGRYTEAEGRFAEAYRRYAPLAAHDTSNAETRMFMARTSRRAGEACQTLAHRTTARGERARWRAKGVDWFEKSLALYRELGKAGALSGQEAVAPSEVSSQLVALQGSPGRSPDSSR
jgi:tetratricopeptide (TPR) repeat protein